MSNDESVVQKRKRLLLPRQANGEARGGSSSATTAISHLTPRGKAACARRYFVEKLYTFLFFEKRFEIRELFRQRKNDYNCSRLLNLSCGKCTNHQNGQDDY